jgi:hypothetical protein
MSPISSALYQMLQGSTGALTMEFRKFRLR